MKHKVLTIGDFQITCMIHQESYWSEKRRWRSYLLWLLDLGAIFDVRDENITRIKEKWRLLVDLQKRRVPESKRRWLCHLNRLQELGVIVDLVQDCSRIKNKFHSIVDPLFQRFTESDDPSTTRRLIQKGYLCEQKETKRRWRNHLLWLQHLGVIKSDEKTRHIKKKWTLIVDPLEKRFRFTESRTRRLMCTVFYTLWRKVQPRREIRWLTSKGMIIADHFVYRLKKGVLDELNELSTMIEKTFVYAGKEEVIDDDEDSVRGPERRPRDDYWGWEEDYWGEDNWAQREHDREDAFRRQGD